MSATPDAPSLAALVTIRERWSKATPGPWYVEEDGDFWELYASNGIAHPLKLAKCPKRSQRFAEYWPQPHDAVAIANAPEDIATLMDAIARLEAENAALREQVERTQAVMAEARDVIGVLCQGSMCCPDGCLADKLAALTPAPGGEHE